MSSCISTESRRIAEGPFDAYDVCEAASSGPEALGVGLFVATGGIGDLIEALGASAETADSAEAAAKAATDLRHYTTADRAEQILNDGQINPSADGNTYLTPDAYADGPSAQSGLALNTTPEGYLDVPTSPGAPAPSLVEGGTGLEVPVRGPVRLPPKMEPFMGFRNG
jgi:hypothetical protein